MKWEVKLLIALSYVLWMMLSITLFGYGVEYGRVEILQSIRQIYMPAPSYDAIVPHSDMTGD